jgi:Raf kinase inhibitor-like YbhB/YbcL family protein
MEAIGTLRDVPRSPRRHPLVPSVGVATALVLIAAAAAGCASGDGRELRPPTEPAPASTVPDDFDGPVDLTDDAGLLPEFTSFELFAAWPDGAAIAERHTCDLDDVSPALSWTGVPDDTIELAITVVDESTGLTHWVVTGIDPAEVSTLEGTVPPGAVEHPNSFDAAAWTGPCPADPDVVSTYRFTVHALDQQLEVLGTDTGSALVALIDGLALSSASVTGTFSRSG